MNTYDALVKPVDEASAYLKIPKSSIFKLAQEMISGRMHFVQVSYLTLLEQNYYKQFLKLLFEGVGLYASI